MRKIKIIFKTILVLSVLFVTSCEDLTELNTNPNAVTIESANLNLMLTTVLTEFSKAYLNDGYGNPAGVMQHTQKDAWYTGHNDYDWGPTNWSGYYSRLRTNQAVYDIAVEKGNEFQQGVTLVMRAMHFALIADFWGDAPYSNALKGDEGAPENLLPSYDTQDIIYQGVIADLKAASTLLSKNADEYTGIYADADVIYEGDPASWQKFANSLLLRYYMRISDKVNVQSDFAEVANSSAIFESNDDDAVMEYLGNNNADAWPNNLIFDDTGGSNFRRKKACGTLVEALRGLNDPRIGVWFAPVAIPTVLDAVEEHNVIIDGVRYLRPDSIDVANVNTNPDFVGYPPNLVIPSAYNYNPTPGQTSYNDFASFLSDTYTEASGDLLKARLMSYSEVSFLLAEAANKGWISNEKTHYENAIEASLGTWGVGDDFSAYIAEAGVAFDGTLEQLMTQKWIAFWTVAQEAWFDYRRTGLPVLVPGEAAQRQVLPLRYEYGGNEKDFNTDNNSAALSNLEETSYSRGIIDSPWSKPWILQGTGNPY